ncbi:MAG TPA: response regulator [bacterium]|nr:response regulator [bacterium]
MSSLPVQRQLTVLLVEDNVGDVRLVREAFREGRMGHRLDVVGDGVEALAYLRRADGHAEAPRPDLILLDLNVPRKSGHEVLREVKEDPTLRRIPVVVFSSSDAERDVALCYDLHANCCVKKPGGLEEFIAILQAIDTFWLRTISMPARSRYVRGG